MIQLGRRIGTGAEGEVYEIHGRSDLVAKVYHETPPLEKAEKLIELSRLGNERLFNLSAWPVSTLLDAPDGEVAGFVMKKISDAEEVHTLHSPKSRLQKFPEASWTFLIYVAANIARAVAAIHEHGLVIGDVNPKNILVTRKATVYLLDVDSFQFSVDGRTYRCEGGFPEYTPPELQGVSFREVDREQKHDCFGLAVVIFQLLFLGRHPYSGTYLRAGEMPLEQAIRESRFAYGDDAKSRKMRQPPGTLALDSMPSALVALFRRAYLTMNRPGPREWVERLDELSKSLKKCDQHSGHYYYRELQECPWCGIEKQARVRLFNFLLPGPLSGEDSRPGHFRLDEIWKEIASVKAPDSSLIRRENILKIPKPSAEVAAYAQNRRIRLVLALMVSWIAGLVFPALIGYPAVMAIPMVGYIACAIGKTWRRATVRSLFRRRQPVPDDPLLVKAQDRWREAEEEAARLQARYDREVGNDRWRAKRDELRNRKETYENLTQIRQFKLQQLEAVARKNQLDEFLDQFKINDAKLKGIGPNLKTVLSSHGVETAADVIEDVTQIPSVGRSRAKWLLEWRRDLERKFVFDPSRGVSPEVRLKTEREVDALRFRLESELIGGAHDLRSMKQEIEASREKLQPALTEARQTLAQAEKDLKVARKSNPAWLIIATLIIAFLIGLSNAPNTRPKYTDPEFGVNSGGRRPIAHADSDNGPVATVDYEKTQEAMKYYRKGERLLRQEKFAGAVDAFRKAVSIDPGINAAYEDLGYALLRQGKYEESTEASEKAIALRHDFRPFYNLGLAHFETKNWLGAQLAFQSAIELRDESSWKDEYTDAYYRLGLSMDRLGRLRGVIAELEAQPAYLEREPLNRFRLGIFYLCIGRTEAAKEQHRLLENVNPPLARELDKLIKKRTKTA
jgi:DNA-binding helix-hairpin-helix protein with protein kinase domain